TTPTTTRPGLSKAQAQTAIDYFKKIHPEEQQNISQHNDEILMHLQKGTMPDTGSPMLAIQYVVQPQPIETLELQQEGDDACTAQVIKVSMDTIMFLMSVLSISSACDKITKDCFGAMQGEEIMNEFQVSIRVLANASDDMSKARALFNMISLVWHTVGLAVYDSIKSNTPWYEWVIYGAFLAAQLAASFASGGLFLIGKIVLMLDNAAQLILDAVKLPGDCESTPQKTLPSSQISLSTSIPGGMSIMGDTSPAVAEFFNELYIFWNGSAGDGIWFTKFDGQEWSSQQSLVKACGGMSMMSKSSPSVTYYDEKLWVFWNGSAGDGMWFSTFDGVSWSAQQSVANLCGGMTMMGYSSPCAAQFNDKLYIFWNGAGNCIWFTTFDGQKWTSQQSVLSLIKDMGVMEQTSPAAIQYNGKLYLIWNGYGKDGLWFTVFDGQNWSAQSSISQLIGGMGVMDLTSPAVCIFNSALSVYWNGSANDGIWFTASDGSKWLSQGSILKLINGMGVMQNTSPASWVFKNKLYNLWTGSGNDGVWFATFPIGSMGTLELNQK
ncbi:hypothetical protein, partial [Fulvivirga kasyanovii]